MKFDKIRKSVLLPFDSHIDTVLYSQFKDDIIEMLDFLIENVCIKKYFNKLILHPLLADFLFYSYEAEFFQNILIKKKHIKKHVVKF